MRLLLTGASGQLGAWLVAEAVAAGHDVVAWSGSQSGERAGVALTQVELSEAASVRARFAEAAPECVIHAAAIAQVGEVHRNPAAAWVVNVEGTAALAEACAASGARLVHVSTDMVFDGSRAGWREEDPVRPVLAYGRSKRAAELAARIAPGALVARVSLLFGGSRGGRAGFVHGALAALAAGQTQAGFVDEFRTPIDLRTAARVLLALAETRHEGVVHVAGPERMSRHELLSRLAIAEGLDASRCLPASRLDVAFAEPRPGDLSLDTSRLAAWLPGLARPRLEDAWRGSR